MFDPVGLSAYRFVSQPAATTLGHRLPVLIQLFRVAATSEPAGLDYGRRCLY